MSGLYGSNAVGGVINIITRRGQGPLTADGARRGRLVRHRVISLAASSGGSDRAHCRSPASVRETDGFNIAPIGDEKDGSRTRHLHVAGGRRR